MPCVGQGTFCNSHPDAMLTINLALNGLIRTSTLDLSLEAVAGDPPDKCNVLQYVDASFADDAPISESGILPVSFRIRCVCICAQAMCSSLVKPIGAPAPSCTNSRM